MRTTLTMMQINITITLPILHGILNKNYRAMMIVNATLNQTAIPQQQEL